MSHETPQQLFDTHQGLAGHVMKQFGNRLLPRDADADDMYQVALMGLWAACQPGKFDPLRGVPFATYAGIAVRNTIEQWLGEAFSQRRAGKRPHVSVETLKRRDDDEGGQLFEKPSREPPPDQRMIDEEHAAAMRRLVRNALRCFTPHRRAILRRRYIDGASWPEVGKEFGYKGQAAQKSTSEVMRKFRSKHPRVKQDAWENLHRRSDLEGRRVRERRERYGSSP